MRSYSSSTSRWTPGAPPRASRSAGSGRSRAKPARWRSGPGTPGPGPPAAVTGGAGCGSVRTAGRSRLVHPGERTIQRARRGSPVLRARRRGGAPEAGPGRPSGGVGSAAPGRPAFRPAFRGVAARRTRPGRPAAPLPGSASRRGPVPGRPPESAARCPAKRSGRRSSRPALVRSPGDVDPPRAGPAPAGPPPGRGNGRARADGGAGPGEAQPALGVPDRHPLRRRLRHQVTAPVPAVAAVVAGVHVHRQDGVPAAAGVRPAGRRRAAGFGRCRCP